MMLSIGNKFPHAPGATKHGFTLIEVMISVAILAVGLSLILQGFAFSLNVLRISQDNLKATLVAENKMAELQIQIKKTVIRLPRVWMKNLNSGIWNMPGR